METGEGVWNLERGDSGNLPAMAEGGRGGASSSHDSQSVLQIVCEGCEGCEQCEGRITPTPLSNERIASIIRSLQESISEGETGWFEFQSVAEDGGQLPVSVGSMKLVREMMKSWSLLGQIRICATAELVDPRNVSAAATTVDPTDRSRSIVVLGTPYDMAWSRDIPSSAVAAAEAWLSAVVKGRKVGPYKDSKWHQHFVGDTLISRTWDGFERIGWVIKQSPYCLFWESVNKKGWLILQLCCKPGFRPPNNHHQDDQVRESLDPGPSGASTRIPGKKVRRLA